MKIEINKNDLIKSLVTATSAIANKNVAEVLSNCCIKLTDNCIQIIGTDNELAIKNNVEAITEGEGSFLVDGNKLKNLLKELPDGDVSLSINKDYKISVKTKVEKVKGSFTLTGMHTEAYPEIPDFIDGPDTGIITQGMFKDMLKKVIPSAAVDTIKPFFNGVFLSAIEDKFSLVATDSRRLSIISKIANDNIILDNVNNAVNREGAIIPLKAAKELFKLLNSTDDLCKFAVIGNQFMLKTHNTEFITRTIDHRFPNYRGVIPHTDNITVTIEKDKLIDSLKRAMVFTVAPVFTIFCKFEGKSLTIDVKNAETGFSTEEIDLQSTTNLDSPISLGINAKYLYAALNEMDSNFVKIAITGTMSPVKLVPEDDPDFISVIMPIRIILYQ